MAKINIIVSPNVSPTIKVVPFAKGASGAQGTSGLQGTQGVQGSAGYIGADGTQGIQGLQGITGSQGANGTQGSNGSQGTVGNTGAQGTQGFTGIQGANGIQGTQGIVGFGVAPNGTAGQILAKNSSTSYDTSWIDNYTTDLRQQVINNTGSTLYKGQAVYISNAGNSSDTPRIALAQANAESTSSKTLGLLMQDLAQGATGFVIQNGLVSGIDTTLAVSGDPVWLSPTVAGGLVFGLSNKPVAPNHLVFLGVVGKSNVNNGSIIVRVQNGFELEELHNLVLTNVQNNDGVIWDSTAGYWKNGKIIGTQGVQGYQGVQGVQGYAGTNGTQGTQGFIGSTGSQGTQGTIGIGSQGTQGSQGITGTGTQGTQGIQGIQGRTGTGTQGTQGTQGIQGLTGSGTQGTQGFSGTNGSQGTQGFTGSTGSQGITGSGTQGTQGIQGTQGFTGTQGTTGSFGGATLDYKFSTNTTSSAPASGYIKFNNADWTLATQMYIHYIDDEGASSYSYLQTIDDSTSAIKGHFSVSNQFTPSAWTPPIFAITGYHTEDSVNQFFTVPISFVSGTTPSGLTDGIHFLLTMARTGDKGDTGAQGIQGLQGTQGFDGIQGATGAGTQGLQGTQGFAGSTGSQGLTGIGLQGTQGFSGLNGAQGVQGYNGNDGTQGAQGAQGITGSGTQGIQGIQGFTGTGTQGIQGFTGTGTQGTQGIQGIQGPSGSAGTVVLTGGTTDPTAPTGTDLGLYTKSLSGKPFLYTESSGNRITQIQNSLYQKNIGLYTPGFGSTTLAPFIGSGTLTQPTTAATLTARTYAATNAWTKTKRIGFVTAATAGRFAGIYTPGAQWTMGNTTDTGGFYMVYRFGITDTAFLTACRTFVGLSSSIATPTNVEPSTLTNIIGVGAGAADTTLKIFYGGSAAQTAIDLGANFPMNATGQGYEVIFSNAYTSTTVVSYQVTNLNTGAVATGTLTAATAGTQLPNTGTMLGLQMWRTNNATATSCAIDLGFIYIEGDAS